MARHAGNAPLCVSCSATLAAVACLVCVHARAFGHPSFGASPPAICDSRGVAVRWRCRARVCCLSPWRTESSAASATCWISTTRATARPTSRASSAAAGRSGAARSSAASSSAWHGSIGCTCFGCVLAPCPPPAAFRCSAAGQHRLPGGATLRGWRRTRLPAVRSDPSAAKDRDASATVCVRGELRQGQGGEGQAAEEEEAHVRAVQPPGGAGHLPVSLAPRRNASQRVRAQRRTQHRRGFPAMPR